MKPILIIEDNPSNMKLSSFVLEQAGYEVWQAATATDGLRLAYERPALILMDIQLPGMDGLEAARRLKSDPATRAIPIIALTAFAMRGDQNRVLSAGCDAYLAKPVRYEQLLSLVAATLGGSVPP